MGLFFTRQNNLAGLIQPRLRAALLAPPPANPAQADTAAHETAGQIVTDARPTFSVPRFVCAFGFVAVLFLLYVWAAHDDKMAPNASALFHLFEVLTSGLSALLVGEASSSG